MTDTLRPATSRSVTFDEGETDVRRMRGIGIVAIVSIMLASCALPPRPSGTPAQPRSGNTRRVTCRPCAWC